MNRWSDLSQWFYPREFRIGAGTSLTTAVLLAASASQPLERAGPDTGMPSPVAGDVTPVPAPTDTGLEKGFVIDLCNNFHRLSRSLKPLQDATGAEATRLKRNLDQVRKTLQDNGIECLDLTGEVYDPRRSDFQPLGEPQETPGLTRMTIIQCERPLVKIKGRFVQPAKGIVGRPSAG